MGTDQRRTTGRGRAAIWPPAHADRSEHMTGSTRVDIAGREPRLGQQLGLRAAGAGLLAAAGAIHLDLYLTGYRTIPTIAWLVLLQVIAAFCLGVAVLAIPSRLVIPSRLAAAAGAGFAPPHLGRYLLSFWPGLFGV